MELVGTSSREHSAAPLETYIEGFETELIRLGFTPFSTRGQLSLMRHLSRWLQSRGLAVEELTVEVIEVFLRERRASHAALFTFRALKPLLKWLATSGRIAVEAASPRQIQDPPVLIRFEEYLRGERRLKEISVQAQVSRVRRFLNGYTPPGGLRTLSAADVVRALLDEGEGRKPVSVKKFGYVLRSFLRFCFLVGELDRDLTGATLVVRLPQPSLLPIGVSPGQIQTLLDACDRNTSVGKRDYAMVLLLARLGLRAGEVAGLHLEDIDWHHGEFMVRGKGSKDERLPLPDEVGAAIADYLLHARPAAPDLREAFSTVKAPWRGLSSPAVWAIVVRACKRAGMQPFGAHRLRHSLGEAMVRAEVPLAAIGQVLRHDDPVTTANYARVDVTRLRTLAQPWAAEGSPS
ncbi:site-specific integrase [Paeniglutamicibacter psychrophenolicus]|uniref:Site-specific recombinase XerD n=1 Tax=Paeniglutamicibacter psychrophenolicus TaxID=257454 RepID=A0ABS4WCE9_9MICC|nr:tyrosine-type recombinase/integrase [Paeniglutamicibacter psychrophenolicus]MBP2373284.1 site-specific recombinase XerD [Paeniglutamicibacter psychrophenolicus]